MRLVLADPLTPTLSDRICNHMNDEQSEAVVRYAQGFGDRPQTEKAQMVAVDPQVMDLSIEVQETMEMLRIPFHHVLQDSEDAHQTLIAMVRQARTRPLQNEKQATH